MFEFLNGVATNLPFLLPLRMLHARRRTADTCACLGLIITSSAYHYCDAVQKLEHRVSAPLSSLLPVAHED